MQFKHPELLYALLLLLIPIIVHLFQLRRFQQVAFTNVQFLKQVTLKTRKSSQLKKWITLLIRLLLLAAIILAFAQPYQSKLQNLITNTETVIYLDNSFSMQAKGEKGELFKRAVQDIISAMDNNDELTIFTNNSTLKNAPKKTVKDELLTLKYSSNQLGYEAAILKGKQLFSKEGSHLKYLVLISDFQLQGKEFLVTSDSLINISLVQLKPINTNNISIDSVYISKTNANSIELTVLLKQQNNTNSDISISLFNNNNLIAKTSVNSNEELKGTFTIPSNIKINGKITIEDATLKFDNTLYFNINIRPKINVLSISSANDNYLKRVFTNDEFNFNSTNFNDLNYNEIEKQNLIILNELNHLPLALINTLKAFANNGGNILIIPSINITVSTYNNLFTGFINVKIDSINNTEKKVTTINYSHPIYHDVFNKKVFNFQYPKVKSFYNLISSNDPILQLEDGKPFLLQSENVFIFSSALNSKNSNFIDSPLIVPTLYNIGRQSLQLPKIYYTIGKENTFDISTTMQQDDILKLKSSLVEIIPQQRTFSNKVTITTIENPNIAAIYEIANRTKILEYISYNYNRIESKLNYININTLENVKINNSIPQFFKEIKSDTNVNELWKWFIIFALMLLVIEMLVLRYYK